MASFNYNFALFVIFGSFGFFGDLIIGDSDLNNDEASDDGAISNVYVDFDFELVYDSGRFVFQEYMTAEEFNSGVEEDLAKQQSGAKKYDFIGGDLKKFDVSYGSEFQFPTQRRDPYSSVPTRDTHRRHAAAKQYIHHFSPFSFPEFPETDNAKLHRVSSNIVSMEAYYLELDNSPVMYYGSGWFLNDQTVFSVRHLLNDFICRTSMPKSYLTYGDAIHPDCVNNRTENGIWQLPVNKDLIYISNRYDTIRPLQMVAYLADMLMGFSEPHVQSFESAERFDVTKITVTGVKDFKNVDPLVPTKCQVGDKIILLGHPAPVTTDVLTADGYIEAEEANEFLYKGLLTGTMGKITRMNCDEAGEYSFRFMGIAWSRMSGGAIVRAKDPSQLCGMFSYSPYTARYHVGICYNHPLIEQAQHCPS